MTAMTKLRYSRMREDAARITRRPPVSLSRQRRRLTWRRADACLGRDAVARVIGQVTVALHEHHTRGSSLTYLITPASHPELRAFAGAVACRRRWTFSGRAGRDGRRPPLTRRQPDARRGACQDVSGGPPVGHVPSVAGGAARAEFVEVLERKAGANRDTGQWRLRERNRHARAVCDQFRQATQQGAAAG